MPDGSDILRKHAAGHFAIRIDDRTFHDFAKL